MNYHLKINKEPLDLDVSPLPENRLRDTTGDTAHDVRFHPVGPNRIHLHIDGRAVTAWIFEEAGEKQVMIEGALYRVTDADDTAPLLSEETRADTASGDVTSPMPAVVVAVPAGEGAMVKKGDPLVVVSAMKMEATLTAPFAGRVTRVRAAVGDNVMPGEILVDLTPEEEA